MSYILDALQRAESERQRGQIPNLHMQQAPDAPAAAAVAPWRWALAALALCALLAVGAAWWFWRAAQQAVLAAPPSATTPALALPPPPPPPPPPQSPPPQPVLAAAPEAVPAALPPVAAPPKAAERATAAAAVPPALPAASVPSVTASAAAATKAGAAGVPVPLLAELAEDLRSQIGPLAVGGVVYSENPAQRLLLLGGQVLGQGSAVTATLRLEEIGPHAAVFNFQGTRFRLAY